MKKNNSLGNYLTDNTPIKHFLSIMRATIILLFVFVFCTMAETGYSQNARVTINKKNVSLKEILNEIENQTDYLFIYNNEVNANQNVSLKVQQESVATALSSLLKSKDVSYSMEGNHIILSTIDKALAAEKPSAVSTSIQQQKKKITGTITDETGEPIIGANVVEVGTTNGTVTDFDGQFSIDVANDASIRVSYIGYLEQDISTTGRNSFNITIREDNQALEELVVVGYGVQRKVTSTGAVSQVDGDNIQKMSVANASKALQGISPGVTIIDRGGAPGADDPQIFLRGVGTTGNAAPLVLVDGVEMSLSQVPSQEIESISILKDAASASIYGSRAAHGVLLITTKRGKSGKAQVTYNGYVGLQDLAIRPKQVNAQEYLEMVNEASHNAGFSPIFSDEYINKTVSGVDPYNYPYVNYIDEIFKPAYMTEHTLSVRGGTENVKYLTMFNFLDQPGIIKNTDFQRYNYRMNVDIDITKNLRLSNDISYRRNERLWSTQLGAAQYRAFSMVPTVPVTYEDGRYTLDDQQHNPVASADINAVGSNNFVSDNLTGQVKAEFEPLKDLIFTGSVSINGSWSRNKVHNKNHKFYDKDNNFITQWNAQNGVYDSRNNNMQMTLRFLANYSKIFDKKHNLQILYGMEQESYRSYWSQAERRNLVSDALPDVSLGSASNQYAYGEPTAWGINSFFGRINYGYKDKYLFEANLRTDGSSRFAKGNKWGIFPSVSAAYRISEEEFMKDISFLDNLKIRASWGQTGNERIPTSIGRFLYLPQFSTEDVVMDGKLVTGVRQTKMSNPNLTWETVESVNLGVDFSFFNSAFFGEFDLYSKDTKDILLSLAIPKFIGLEPPHQNVGVVNNRGFELMLGHRKTSGDFNYTITGNLAYNKNEWKDRLGDDDNISGWIIERSGRELNSFYIYKSDGLIANEQELEDYKAKHVSDPRGISVLRPGDVKLVDTNNDGTIDPKDRQVFSSNIPKLIFGINFNAEYKNFDLSLLLQGTSGANRYLYGEFYEGPSYQTFTGIHFRDRWTEQNQDGNARVPRLEAATNRNIATYNSFYLRDISYLRLKNVQIGYTLPRSFTEKFMVSSLRLYLSGSNLFTLSTLDQGMDPESSSGRPTEYPPQRVYSFGVNLTF